MNGLGVCSVESMLPCRGGRKSCPLTPASLLTFSVESWSEEVDPDQEGKLKLTLRLSLNFFNCVVVALGSKWQ